MPPRTGFNNYRTRVAAAYVIAYLNQYDSVRPAYDDLERLGVDTPRKALAHIKGLIDEYERNRNS